MNKILISIGILLICLIIIVLCKETNNYKPFDIKPSVLLKDGERGLFATRNYQKGDIIER